MVREEREYSKREREREVRERGKRERREGEREKDKRGRERLRLIEKGVGGLMGYISKTTKQHYFDLCITTFDLHIYMHHNFDGL